MDHFWRHTSGFHIANSYSPRYPSSQHAHPLYFSGTLSPQPFWNAIHGRLGGSDPMKHEKWLSLKLYSFTYKHHTQRSSVLCIHRMTCQCSHSSCDNKSVLEVTELANPFPEQCQAPGFDGWAGAFSLCASSCPPPLSFAPGYLSSSSGCTWTAIAHNTVF